eukprot:TRINITY_DN4707_c0_g2_i6.p1 TRINITY_DN4707_c0_g2~~TRINITY_DN4707_c0_g2_i6.p1  ORF type:complete len:191 (-),score=11.37 TRINITY_DN4707_c0_g2_i6:13-585(-)
MNLHCNLALTFGTDCVGQVGDDDTVVLAAVESTLKYHPVCSGCLTWARYPGQGHCLVGSLTGAVASQMVTEAHEGSLRLIGNQPKSVKAQGSLTASHTRRAGTKVGFSDPVVLSGRAIAQRIKGTLGITGLSPPRVHIDGEVRHLDVGSSHPGAVAGPKGWAVRPLKWYASWVQTVVRQVGLYPLWAQGN